MHRYILGLDISTSYVGVAILGLSYKGELKLLRYEAINLKGQRFKKIKDKTLQIWEKLDYAIGQIEEIACGYSIDHVAIEGILKQHGKSTSATTLVTLAYFNGMITDRMRIAFSDVKVFNPTVAKNKAGCTIKVRKALLDDKSDSEKYKRAVARYIDKMFDNFEIKYTQNGNMSGGMFDKADATIVAVARAKELTNEIRRL